MAGVLVGSAVLSGFFNVLLDRLATPEFLNFFLPDEVINFDKLLWELDCLLRSADVLMDDAEEKRIHNKKVEEWLTELKDVVFKAGEVVDKIETEALRLKMEGGQSTSLFSIQVKSELEKILSSLKFLLDRKEELGLQAAGRNRSSEVRTRLSERSTPVVDESDFCGREDIKESIIQSLRSPGVGGDKVSVIPVIGAGGLGKTTLVQLIYDLPEVEQLFEEFRAWVTVSTEFDLPTITKTIIGMIADPSVINGTEDQKVLLFKLRNALKGKRFLLVLDDVWSEDLGKWDTLKSCFKSAESGSKIIVTTRSAKVASIMAPIQNHHFLQRLPEKDCLKLFAQTVFSDDQGLDAYPDWQEIGEKIVRGCKGNPLSVVTVAGILRGDRDPEYWEKILKSTVWELLQQGSKHIIPSLWLSYLYLPSEIKPCFAYCSVFPKDHPFQKKEVVRLWMAEGFLKNGAGKTMEEVGEEYFEELISRSLFQRSNEWYSGETFIMHDLVRDLAVNVSGEFCFCLEGEKNLSDLSCKTRYLSYDMEILDVKKFEGLSKAERLHTFVGLRRPLSLITPSREFDILKVLAEVSGAGACLRVLSLSRYYKIDSLRDSLGKLKHLRYLDLSHTDVRELPDSVCTLYNLQTLLLRGCGNLTTLPESIGNLKELRHLDLSNSDVRELPDSIGTLDNLQTLLLLGCRNLTLLPCNRGSLINLHHLDIGHSSKLELLGNCRYGLLKDLMIVKCQALNWIPLDYFPKLNRLVLMELECLVALTGESADELKWLFIEECPKLEFTGNGRYGSLKELILVKCEALKSFPLDYFPKLNTLVLKELECLVDLTGESADELKWLSIEECPKLEFSGNGRYGSFKVLKIKKCEALKSIPLDYFPNLNRFDLQKCGNVESFTFAEEPPLVLESLTYISISECENLRSLPQQMHRLLPSLKDLHVRNCGEIESWPEGGLPSNLESLVIWECKKLCAQVMHLDLQVTCLKSFGIDGCGEELLDSFPPEGLLPTSLTSLWIANFRRLKTLNIHVFQHLKELHVFNFDELQCLPEESLPNSLVKLDIYECPLLERRYRKETGQGWHKISHIPEVQISEISTYEEQDL